MKQEILDRVKKLPRKPGVYLFKNDVGKVLYVGKATSLRERVSSYFNGSDPRAFVRHLDRYLEAIDVIVTASPKEALLLENTLIKEHQPRFNFKLRDDKTYFSLKIDPNHRWPRVRLVRQQKQDGAWYFGPYHSAQGTRKMLGVLNRHFQLRTCTDSVLNNRSRPCLQYQIKRCPAPCVYELDRDSYMGDVNAAKLFLEGRSDDLVRDLESTMHTLAEEMRFEEAASVRDKVRAIRGALEKQIVVQQRKDDIDCLALYRGDTHVAFALLVVRAGALQDVASWLSRDVGLPEHDLVEAFLGQYYGQGVVSIPAKVALSTGSVDTDALSEWLGSLRGKRCQVSEPQRGDTRRLIEMALRNAQEHHEAHASGANELEDGLTNIARRLRLGGTPRTMECYDISNFQGSHVVASQVTFVDGVPDTSGYRRYKIRSVDGQDDFASMFEVLSRRARHARDGKSPMPDLIVIDGGLGQLNQARAALQDLGLHDQEIVSLAKSRVQGADADDQITRSDERVFVPNVKDPIVLRSNQPEFRILTHIRNEAHRFAITFHRELRRKATLHSSLDEIPGVGPSRRKQLLNHFGSLRKVREAALVELEAVEGLPRPLAARIYAYFNPDHIDAPPTDEMG